MSYIGYQYIHSTGEGMDDAEKLDQIKTWCEEFGWTFDLHQNADGQDILTISATTADESEIRGTIDYLKAEVW